jgi:outer membrane protein assembly factor BamB
MTGIGVASLPDQLEERWTFKTGNTVEGAPAIVQDTVFVTSLDKHLYALDLKTGQEKWKVKLGPMRASPAVQGNRLVVGDSNGKVHCLDLTGKILWTFETEGEITAGANFHRENILIGSHDSTLYYLDSSGKKLWDFKIDGPVNGSPAVIGDVTFVAGCDSILHAVDLKTGKELWNVDLEGQAAATAAILKDHAYVGLMTNQVVSIDLKAKKKAWTFEPVRRSQPFYASAAATDKLIITGSRDRKVYALDRITGAEKWSFITEGQVDSSPVVVGNKIYVGALSSTCEFYVLDLETGKKLQELTLDSAVTGSAAVGPDCLLVGTEKGTVYCLGKK